MFLFYIYTRYVCIPFRFNQPMHVDKQVCFPPHVFVFTSPCMHLEVTQGKASKATSVIAQQFCCVLHCLLQVAKANAMKATSTMKKMKTMPAMKAMKSMKAMKASNAIEYKADVFSLQFTVYFWPMS